MSDVMEKEEVRQIRLQKTFMDLLITVIAGSIGWIMLSYALALATGMSNGFLILLGGAIGAGPVLYQVFMRGPAGLKFWHDYEVITTYGDGRKESDGGAEATQMNIVLMIIALIIGGLITLIKCVYLPIKYAICYKMVKEKPAFLTSGFPIMLAGFIVLIGAPILFNGIALAEAKAFHKAQNTADYTGAEARKMIETAKANFLSNDYGTEFFNTSSLNNRIQVNLSYTAADNRYWLRIDNGSDDERYMSGIYTLTGNELTDFRDFWFVGRDPTQAEIDAARDFLPENYIFNSMLAVNDSEFIARNMDDGTIKIYIGSWGSFTNEPPSITLRKDGNNYNVISAGVNRVEIWF